MNSKIELALQGGHDVYKNVSIENVLNVARQYGIKYAQLWYLEPYNNLRKDKISEAQAILDRYEIGVTAVSTWTRLNLPGDVSSAQHTILESIDLANQLNCKFVTTYFGPNSSRSQNEAIEFYVRQITPCIEKAEQAGITILMENEFDHQHEDPNRSDVTRIPEGILQLVESIGSSHFKLTFDAANFYCAGIEPYPYAYELLKDHIAYVHIKDMRNYYVSLKDKYYVFDDGSRAKYLSVPLGEGAINHEALIRRMQDDDFEGFFVIETFCLNDQFGEFYQKAIQYLKGKKIG